MIDPHVEPMDFSVASDGEIVVAIRQTVRDLSGKVVVDNRRSATSSAWKAA